MTTIDIILVNICIALLSYRQGYLAGVKSTLSPAARRKL